MRKLLFSLISSGLAVAATLAFLGGSLNCLFGWSIGIGKGSSRTPLPDDWVSVFALSGTLYVLSAISWVVANPREFIDKVRRHRLVAAGLTLAVIGTIAGAIYQLSGGALGSAMAKGDAAKVRELINSGKYPPSEVESHLYQSLKKKELVAAQALLAGGANVNRIAGQHRSSLLGDAVVFFPMESVRLLLQQKADPNLKDTFGRTPALVLVLYRAANFPQEGEEGAVALLQALRTAGGDLGAAATDGQTPLSVATERGLTKVAAFLKSR